MGCWLADVWCWDFRVEVDALLDKPVMTMKQTTNHWLKKRILTNGGLIITVCSLLKANTIFCATKNKRTWLMWIRYWHWNTFGSQTFHQNSKSLVGDLLLINFQLRINWWREISFTSKPVRYVLFVVKWLKIETISSFCAFFQGKYNSAFLYGWTWRGWTVSKGLSCWTVLQSISWEDWPKEYCNVLVSHNVVCLIG